MRVQLASDDLSKNFPLTGCPVNPNEAQFFLLKRLANRSLTGHGPYLPLILCIYDNECVIFRDYLFTFSHWLLPLKASRTSWEFPFVHKFSFTHIYMQQYWTCITVVNCVFFFLLWTMKFLVCLLSLLAIWHCCRDVTNRLTYTQPPEISILE